MYICRWYSMDAHEVRPTFTPTILSVCDHKWLRTKQQNMST